MLSSSSSYPFQGIIYFLAHPRLWSLCLLGLLIGLLVTLVTLGLGFGLLLPLQANAIIAAGAPAWAGWLVGVIATILESSLIILILVLVLQQFMIEALVNAVWKERGVPYSGKRSWWNGFFADAIMTTVSLIVLILTFPLNLAPVVGTLMYCQINGFVYAWERQLRYQGDAKGWTWTQARKYAFSHKRVYAGFGGVALLLQLVPLVGFVAAFTNAVGAALWAADQYEEEQKRVLLQHGVPRGLVEAATSLLPASMPASESDVGQPMVDVLAEPCPPPPEM